MPRYAILRQTHTDSAVFATVKESLRQSHLWESAGDEEILEWVALSQGMTAGENFDRAAAFITRELGGGRSLTVLVDEIDPLKLDPLMAYGWNTLVSMLILAFPEVRWHFLVLTGRPDEKKFDESGTNPKLHRWRQFQSLHGIQALHERRGTPLFDGYGIRQHVLDCVLDREKNDESSQRRSFRITGSVPNRLKVATVLDEEEGYRWLLACMAHRNGFRVFALASWTETEKILGAAGRLNANSDAGKARNGASGDFVLSLEDWFLSYPDQNIRKMSDLQKRSETLPALNLNPPPLRRFLTVGHQEQSKACQLERKNILKELRDKEHEVTGKRLPASRQCAYKPASGLYTLWKELGLNRDWSKDSGNYSTRASAKKYRGLAPGYYWPPEVRSVQLDADEGHSSAGRMLHIAEHLIARCNTFIDGVNTVTEAVRGAVLATQALELLGGKTPTVSVEALLLKHEFEVTAECQFVGVEYHLSMDERLSDIRKNLQFMSRWLHKSRRREFELNAEAMIVTRLIATLDEYGEYEESQTCQRRLRALHHQVAIRNDLRRRSIFAILSWPFRAYIEFVLRSLGHFSGAILVLTIIFSYLFMVTLSKPFLEGLHYTMQAVFTVTFQEVHQTAKCISYATAASGVLNFGLLVTYLYSKITRR